MTNHIVLLIENNVVVVCENYFFFPDACYRIAQLDKNQFVPTKQDRWNGTEIVYESTGDRYLGILMVRWENNIF